MRHRVRGAGPRAGRLQAGLVPGSSPSTMFSQTVRLSASMKCWNTMPMPAAIASRGEREARPLAVDGDRALVGPMRAVERLHQRRLAGTVLADDRVDGAGAHRQVDPVVGDDTGEALDDVVQLDRRRCRNCRSSPAARSSSMGCLVDSGRDAASCPPGGPDGQLQRSIGPMRNRRIGVTGSGSRRHLDLTADDLLLERVELVGDVVDEAAGRGVADAVDREVERLHAGRRTRRCRTPRWCRTRPRRPSSASR